MHHSYRHRLIGWLFTAGIDVALGLFGCNLGEDNEICWSPLAGWPIVDATSSTLIPKYHYGAQLPYRRDAVYQGKYVNSPRNIVEDI